MAAACAAVAAIARRWRLAAGLVLLVPLKLFVEKDVLKALVHRERPGTTIPGAVLRDVPSAGDSFPSGHAIVTVAVLVLIAPYVARRWQLLLLAVAAERGRAGLPGRARAAGRAGRRGHRRLRRGAALPGPRRARDLGPWPGTRRGPIVVLTTRRRSPR